MIPDDLEIALREMKQIICTTSQECIEVLRLIKSLDFGFDFDEYTEGLMSGDEKPDLDYLCPGLSTRSDPCITCYRNEYAHGPSFEEVMDIAAQEQEPDLEDGVGVELVSGLFSMLM